MRLTDECNLLIQNKNTILKSYSKSCKQQPSRKQANINLYLVDGWIVAENVAHWQHDSALNASLHDQFAIFHSCLTPEKRKKDNFEDNFVYFFPA